MSTTSVPWLSLPLLVSSYICRLCELLATGIIVQGDRVPKKDVSVLEGGSDNGGKGRLSFQGDVAQAVKVCFIVR